MKNFIYLLFLTMLPITVWSQDVSLTASAPKIVSMNEQFRLTFSVNSQGRNFSPPNLSNFRAQGPTTQTSHSSVFVNGQMKQEVSYSFTYYLRAKKVGKYTIKPASIEVNGKKYTSKSIKIEVIKSGSGASNTNTQQSSYDVTSKDFFVRVNLSKTQVYQNQHIIATIKVYTKVGLAGFNDMKFPTFDGFWSQDIYNPDQISLTTEKYNGEVYKVGVLKQTLLFPQHAGELTIEPLVLDAVLRKPVPRYSFFDSGFRNVNKKVRSNARKVIVKGLPSNQPAEFNGGVGDFKFEASIDKNKVRTNETINLKITISGNGNLKLVKLPKVKLPSDFEQYDPQIQNNIKNTTQGSVGSKVFEYPIIPRHSGEFVIPSIKFAYFDTKSGTYKTLNSKEFKILVEKGENDNETNVVSSGFNKEAVEFIESDIRFIKSAQFSLQPKDNLFFGSMGYKLLFSLSASLFIAILIIRRKTIQRNANMVLVRNRRANKISKKRLREAHKHLKNNKAGEFYTEILQALWGYLGDKLSIPVSELSKESASENLKKNNVNEVLVAKFTDVINTCEFAQYAPSAAGVEMNTIFAKATDIINKLETKLR